MDFRGLDHKFRQDYSKGQLLEETVSSDPLEQFNTWFADIVDAQPSQPNAMILSTVGYNHVPTSRVVLLKHVDEKGFVFFTNYTSDKAAAFETFSVVSLLFFSMELERQIRIHGTIEKVSYEESNDYFKSRPLKSQIAAMASRQSSELVSRSELEASFEMLLDEHRENPPECPDYWGGYRVVPSYYEFWQGRSCRLHDRICYEKQDGSWRLFRKAP